MRQFWELEKAPSSKVLSEEEQKCEQYFCETYNRTNQGQFVVLMPLKLSTNLLGNSYSSAEKQFLCLEKRLAKNGQLYDQYKSFMDEYLKLGHMTMCNLKEFNVTYFLPHRGVINNNSLTTKLRVVFNGSAPSSSGYSLNSLQMVGPTIQKDLFLILFRFRKHHIVICADIEKMYRQVLIAKDQRNLQCILWRPASSEQLKVYILNTVTYGTAAAPFLVIRLLFQFGKDCELS